MASALGSMPSQKSHPPQSSARAAVHASPHAVPWARSLHHGLHTTGAAAGSTPMQKSQVPHWWDHAEHASPAPVPGLWALHHDLHDCSVTMLVGSVDEAATLVMTSIFHSTIGMTPSGGVVRVC